MLGCVVTNKRWCVTYRGRDNNVAWRLDYEIGSILKEEDILWCENEQLD